jgi:MFS family permease/quinol monooxygenase YgiN
MPQPPDPTPPAPPPALPAAWAPLGLPVFRMLWCTWLAANLSMWMNDVAAAWMMTSLAPTPVWVALVQTASTLPVFLLGLPSGALADILDRKRFFFWTQLWVTTVALLMCAAVLTGAMTAPLLLALNFANGIGLALRWPVFAAIVPELVPRAQLPAALALNGVSMNASRIAGPLLAGMLIASFGSQYVFMLNALLSLLAAWLITRWRRTPVPQPLGREKLLSAMRVGLQFVGQSPHLQGVLVRVSLFFLYSTASIALLPLVARGLPGGDASTYTLLLASMGAGAIVTAMLLPRLRQRWSRDGLVARGAALYSVGMVGVALAPSPWVASPAMFISGMAWITTANALSVSAQLGLPNWVRARGMSMYQMSIMGASAAGAALWGQIATWTSVPVSLLVAAAVGLVAVLAANRWLGNTYAEEDQTPATTLAQPVVASPPPSGQVLVNIEYHVDPKRADEFRALMQQSRSSRLRHGVLSWELLRDIHEPGRFVEQFVDPSWNEHLRRFQRLTAADAALRDRRNAFHLGDTPPRVTRCVVESTIRE